jgi:hypothetical protein
MGTLGIFLIGAVVTSLVAGAIALLVYGAVLDGRTNPQTDGASSKDAHALLRDEPLVAAATEPAGRQDGP